MLPPRLRGLVLFLLGIIALDACGSPSSGDVAKELQTVISWEATAHMVGDAWLKRTVPTVFARRTLQSAREELQREVDTLAHIPDMPAQQRTMLLEPLQQSEHIVAQMLTAVEQDDLAQMTQQLQQLSTNEQAIKALAEKAGLQQ